MRKIAYRKSIVSICALAAISLMAGCGKKAEPTTSRLRFGMEKDFVTLDPANLTDPITFRVVGQIYESLLSLDADNKATPALAESWRANDTMDVWTFKIRKGVRFHESPVFGSSKTRDLTPDDVVYSISRSVSPGKVAGFALGGVIAGAADFMGGKAEAVSGLRVVNSEEVEIKLTRPEPYFPYRLTSPYIAIYPKEAVDQGEEVFAKSKPIGTGPYRVVSSSDNEIVLTKNDKYWGQSSPNAPTDISFVVVGNEQLRQIELRNKRLDVAAATPGMLPTVLAKAASSSAGASPSLSREWAGKFGIYSHADFNSYFIAFNTEKVQRPIRRAVNLGVDRKEIANALTFGSGISKWNSVPEGLQGYTPPFTLPESNAAAAKEALANAGGSSGGAGFELLVHELDSSETLGELIQSRMKDVGLNVKITKVTFNEAMRRLVEGDYEAMAMKFQYVFSAPEPILGMLFGSDQIPGANVWLYRSPEVDSLLASYANSGERDQLDKISAQIEKQVYEDAPGVFLYQAQSIFLHNPAIKSFSVNGHGIPLLHRTSFDGP
jgi:ABC-type transport system substrate-binding protein